MDRGRRTYPVSKACPEMFLPSECHVRWHEYIVYINCPLTSMLHHIFSSPADHHHHHHHHASHCLQEKAGFWFVVVLNAPVHVKLTNLTVQTCP